jgi:amino acid permease
VRGDDGTVVARHRVERAPGRGDSGRRRNPRRGDRGGLFNFSLAQAFAYPPSAFTFDGALVSSLGAASVLAMYSYGGYNQVCNIGEEIVDPGRTVPRSIVVSIVIVAALYMAMRRGAA